MYWSLPSVLFLRLKIRIVLINFLNMPLIGQKFIDPLQIN